MVFLSYSNNIYFCNMNGSRMKNNKNSRWSVVVLGRDINKNNVSKTLIETTGSNKFIVCEKKKTTNKPQ